jgi:acyl transferase domain-containing protein/NAD(P)-dependent dehydrogenase (short-subunit alcohol dehydrogenase family)/NAD(P)H-dependent flavin oxidoreductase YrpB (nitropropane dioxygenase family)
MRGEQVRALMHETGRLLGDRPWGVGILGFVPLELRQEQLELVRAAKPAFALIAGGRPDQALSLERAGIPTYLHVPSPSLLRLFWEGGARRFVLEGRECGGHVGPRTSFVLWESMIETLLETAAGTDLAGCHVLFAGGIHDARSSATIAATAAPLVEHGARIGALLGTAYLFTDELVAAGGVVEGFQQEAIRCKDTVLLETGPGHSTRCATTTFVDTFERERRRLLAAGLSSEQLRTALEELNLGRLRIAAKGLVRDGAPGSSPGDGNLRPVEDAAQRAQGMYMLGQVAALRSATVSMDELHHDVAVAGSAQLAGLARSTAPRRQRRTRTRPADAAIVGMACLLPKAPDVDGFWRNVIEKVDAVTEVPADRWDWRRYFDPDPAAPDKTYSRWGGFLDDVAFDPVRFGIPPSSLRSVEPLQLLTLQTAAKALEDAGYADRPFPRERTAVILGVGGGVADLGQQYALRSGLPMVLDEVPPAILSRLPEWTEDTFPGILLNVVAGRVANRLDLGGVNYTVDAACASSLAAVYLAVRELSEGASDMVIVGGADTVQNPFAYLAFSKTHALSPRGRCRTFDEGADGIAISEGVAVLVLKRLADAERDGDRIYAVIKGVAGSSDGRDKGLTAPRPEGQVLALQRAYQSAGVAPSTVRLIEAHGTGTVAGDQAEVETLRRVFEADGAPPDACAIGSVKSMIGHTKCTAGMAGLVKVAKALYHKVLPPTINVVRPNPTAGFRDSPFYVNSESRPWLREPEAPRRRAGVSAFGFGGTNFHAVLEEYTGDFVGGDTRAASATWPAETLVWTADTRQELLRAVTGVERAIAAGAQVPLADLAASLWQAADRQASSRLAVVASSTDDLAAKLASARRALESPQGSEARHPQGVYLGEGQAPDGKLAFLFPGQGSQHPDMLRELAMNFEEVRTAFERAQEALAGRLPRLLGSYVFPPPAFTSQERRIADQELTNTAIAQPALGAASMALTHLLGSLGLHPEMVAGHSYGEYVALCVAGVLSEETLYRLSEARGRCISELAKHDLGTMAAVPEDRDRVAAILEDRQGVWIANHNTPRQTVISGTRAGVKGAVDCLARHGIEARPLNVACAFHSPVVAPARDRLAQVLASVELAAPELPVFSNTTGAPYPRDPAAIERALADHLVRPVRFLDEIEAMYDAGARIFVEVGPRGVLTGLTGRILGSRPHLAVAIDAPGRSGLVQLQLVLAQLLVWGTPVDLDRLYAGRSVRRLNLGDLAADVTAAAPTATTWLVNGGRARPLHEAATGLPTAPPPAPEPSSSPSGNGYPPEEADVAPTRPPHRSQVEVPAVRAMSAGGDPVEVVLAFQRLMGRFLETQQQVMTSFLGGGNGSTGQASREPATDGWLVTPAEEPLAELPAAPAPPDGPATRPTPGDRLDVVATLVAIVSERTGYPPDMLDLDLDLEADLGVDSIKRIEVLGALQRACQPADAELVRQATEKLATLKTLRGLADAVARVLEDGTEAKDGGTVPELPGASPASLSRSGQVQRFLTTLTDTPLDASATPLAVQGTFLITDGGGGVAELVAERLRDAGGHPVLVRPGGRDGGPSADRDVTVDLADAVAIDAVVRSARQGNGGIAGLVHLLPLQTATAPEPTDPSAWQRRLDLEVKALFRLARAVGPDLLAAADGGGGWFIAATAAGGAGGTGLPLLGHGGIAGIAKTLALEWPQVHVKVVDMDPGVPAQEVAARILDEMTARDPHVEIGYQGARRTTPTPLPAPLTGDAPSHGGTSEPGNPLDLDAGSVVLVTGGARGITAVIARGLARHRPVLLLTGRSAPPAAEEPAATAGTSSPHLLKAALADELRAAGQPVTPARVEMAYTRLLHDREIRENLAAMRRAGATVHYHQADVRDEGAFTALLDDIYRTHGRLDGVIHGAGVIEDKLVHQKSDEAFERVFDTKVTGALTLSHTLQHARLRFLVFFTSVAGRFGNRGQSDYAAANEVLNKLALHLDRRWPGRVVAINWGPWGGTGMVTPEVLRRFAERDIEVIDPELGWRAFERELRDGRKGEVEVILAAGSAPTDRRPGLPTPVPAMARGVVP